MTVRGGCALRAFFLHNRQINIDRGTNMTADNISLITMLRFTFNQFDWFMDKEEMAKKTLAICNLRTI